MKDKEELSNSSRLKMSKEIGQAHILYDLSSENSHQKAFIDHVENFQYTHYILYNSTTMLGSLLIMVLLWSPREMIILTGDASSSVMMSATYFKLFMGGKSLSKMPAWQEPGTASAATQGAH